MTVTEMLQNSTQHHLLVLGEPGGGKSTLLRILAQCAWHAPKTVGLSVPHLPILVSLPQLAAEEGSFEERLNRVLSTELALTHRLPEGFLTDWPAQTGAPWLILLDALDEVSIDKRHRFVQWIGRMLKLMEKERVIVASRPNGVASSDLACEQLECYALQPFTPEQTDQFVRNWIDDDPDHFVDELDRMRVGDLVGTPLLLTVAVQVYLENGMIPQRRSSLYEQFVDIWLSESEQRGLRAELGERVHDVAKLLLARIARALTERPHEATETAIFAVAAASLRDMLQLSKEEAEANSARFVRIMAQRSGLFISRGRKCVFIHPTFREYLAAYCWAIDLGADAKSIYRLVERHRTYLRETILFFLGILSDSSSTEVAKSIKRLVDQERDSIYFAADCMAEGIAIDVKTRSRIVQRLLAQAASWNLNAHEAIASLAKLRDNTQAVEGLLSLARQRKAFFSLIGREAVYALATMRYTDDLVRIVNDEQIALTSRIYAAEALIRVHNRTDAIPMLKTLASDGGLDPHTRCFAAELIGEAGHTRVAAKWLRSLARKRDVDAEVRCDAASALAGLGYQPEAVTILLSLASKKKAHKAQRTCSATQGGMQKYLFDKDASVRATAAFALGRLGRSDVAIPTLVVCQS